MEFRTDSFNEEQWKEYQQLKAAAVGAGQNGHATHLIDLAKAQNLTLVPAVTAPLRLDLGCGKNKKEGFTGVDILDFPGVDVTLNIGKDRWPWNDSSVDEAHCSHTVEHLRFNPEFPERIHFINELWRVLKPGAKALIVVPHWNSCRQYGDYTHREPVSEFWFPYLQKAWRKDNAPHDTLYTCDFDCQQPGYSLHPDLVFRATERQQYALQWFKEAAQDMIATLIAKK